MADDQDLAGGPHKTFIVRIVSGTSIRCGGFTFAQATRVSVPSVGIDIPVIRGSSGYPLCRVAMYLAVGRPASRTRDHVHLRPRQARDVPAAVDAVRDRRRRSLIGKTVKVWTSDSYVSYYRILRVRKTKHR